MATKKATKEAPVVKTIEELKADLATKQQDLIEATRGRKMGELVNTNVLPATRKEIARLHTAIRALEKAEVKETK